jgi:hypothetical protein
VPLCDKTLTVAWNMSSYRYLLCSVVMSDVECGTWGALSCHFSSNLSYFSPSCVGLLHSHVDILSQTPPWPLLLLGYTLDMVDHFERHPREWALGSHGETVMWPIIEAHTATWDVCHPLVCFSPVALAPQWHCDSSFDRWPGRVHTRLFVTRLSRRVQ